jgi:phage/plasmid-like protein (TIGR03299 family)
MDSLAAEGGIKYHTAGSLFNGRRVWLLAKLQGSVFVRGERLDKYLLLHNAHDGSSSLSVQFTAIRVVCNNTCNFALGDKTNQFRARHTTNIMTKVKSAADILGLADDHFNTLADTGQRMSEKRMNKFQFMALTRKLFEIEDMKWDDLKAPMQQQLNTLDHLFANGKGNGGNTAWDGFNAFTEYIDHDAIIGRKLDTLGNNAVAVQEKRLDRAWFGPGATLKQAAWNELVDFVGVN